MKYIFLEPNHLFNMLKRYNSTNILNDKDDIDVICPTNSSHKYELSPLSRYEWHVLKRKLLEKYDFSN